MSPSDKSQRDLTFAMRLSLWIGFLMLAMKMGAYLMTRSAAILSDAAESVVHVAAVGFAAYSLSLSYKPADENHPYGHAKISFFSAGFEGGMIILAAIYIIYESVLKWIQGALVENLGVGTVLTSAAVLINGALGWFLIWTGKRRKSLIIEANGHHVLTDCWTSIGVVVALLCTMWTGWGFWDPVCGLAMGTNILVTGFKLIRRSSSGLMDEPDPKVVDVIRATLDKAAKEHDVQYHGLRVRPLGDRHAVEVHVLLADERSVADAHETVSEIEGAIRAAIEPAPYVITHMEPIQAHHEDHDVH